MSDPATAVTSKDHCSVINDEILYIYSEDGMQSLPLKKGGKWQTLPMGVSITGAQCILAPSDDDSKSAMYIVGGAANSSMSDYTGLQRYTFASKKWDIIKPLVTVTQNRQNHGAAYLKDSSSILVYAGSQDTADPTLSSQTFLISTSPPYDVQSYTSTAPPLTQPQVMTWNDSHAVLIGGGTDNKAVYTFGAQEGWADLGTTLQQGLQSHTTMGCDIVMGDDGSKVLETYDLSKSPNEVARIVLWADGQPAKPGQTVGGSSSSSSSRKRKRDSTLTLKNWPPYNDSLAPTVKRNGYSLASDGNGLAVISGGASKDAIVVFDQRKNAWVNTTQLLGSQAPLSISSSSSARPSSTDSASSISPPTSSASATSAPTDALSPPDGDSHTRTMTVLGATLGTIFGLAAILIIILLLLRWKREKRKRAEAGYVNEKEQDRLSFADQGTEFMHTAGGSVGHQFSASMNNSVTSLNIIAGKMGNTKSAAAHKRNGGALGSDASTMNLIQKKPSPLRINDSVEMSRMRSETGIATSPKLITIPSPRATRTPPAMIGDPPLSPGAILAARGQAGMTSRPISRSGDVRPGSSGSASRGGAIVAGMGGAGGGARSSGWSRYFANNEHTTNLAGGALAPRKGSVGSARSGASASQYTRDSAATGSQITYPSQTVMPLELNLGPKFDSSLDGQRLSRVATGSPTLGHTRDHSAAGRELDARGQKAEIARTVSGKSTVETASSLMDFSFGSTAADGTGTANTWTPVSASPGWNDVPGAKATTGQDNHGSVTSSVYSRNPQSYYPAYDDRRNLYTKSTASAASTVWPAPPKSSHGEENRDSTVTVFPRGIPDSPALPPLPAQNGKYGYGQGEAQEPAKKVPVGEDVSWLNLGGNAGSAY
ncbi:hypothetical protein NA57DRAFT_80444 [Rhizodiscina lignyota]|uniref:Pre-mRNA splicing factor CLF1 n=1 Tax=Rhizodiscina lignyota TaxID=1504668 RepID=A0A9P4M4V3_9PEZI|nr:hypothetical protein NA57DRAFT_80444 [Rhizodiscina lignyota]